MPRAKKYIDKDVLTAGRERIEHVYDLFDHTVVMFSGGKDSEALLLLVKEFHEKNGLGPVTVAFRHEEVINPSVLKFVETFRHYDWCNLHWFCLPMSNGKFVLGQKEAYIEWDPDREWVGQQPEWAITGEDVGMASDGQFDQHSVDDQIANYLCGPGSVAFLTGVRASESLVRFRSVTQKLNENYISSIEHNQRSRVKLCKPIYDWEQNDVLQFIYESGMPWCEVYEAQEIAGIGLRVSTALHAAAAKKFKQLAEIEPEFYEQILEIFPDMADQARYWDDFDQNAIIAPYLGRGFNGAMRYVEEQVPPEQKKEAIKRVVQWKARYEKDPKNYPIDLLLKTLAFGKIKQRLTGIYVDSKGYKGPK